MYIVKNLRQGTTRTNKPYYMFDAFTDGKIHKSKVWDIEEEILDGDAIEGIKVKEEFYKGTTQFIFSEYKVLKDVKEKDKMKALGITAIDSNSIYKNILSMINENTFGEYKDICSKIYKDKKYKDFIKESFGARGVHHDYKGGLIEHTEEVCKICLGVLDIYPTLNRNLLIAGAILHDLGKIYTYNDDGINAEHSFDGHMEEHLYMGCEIVNSVIDPGIQTKKSIVLLKHMILSHHGQRDWGSPVVPVIPEAMILHFADNMSAKVKIYEKAKRENSNGKEFTDFIRQIDTSVYTGEIE